METDAAQLFAALRRTMSLSSSGDVDVRRVATTMLRYRTAWEAAGAQEIKDVERRVRAEQPAAVPLVLHRLRRGVEALHPQLLPLLDECWRTREGGGGGGDDKRRRRSPDELARKTTDMVERRFVAAAADGWQSLDAAGMQTVLSRVRESCSHGRYLRVARCLRLVLSQRFGGGDAERRWPVLYRPVGMRRARSVAILPCAPPEVGRRAYVSCARVERELRSMGRSDAAATPEAVQAVADTINSSGGGGDATAAAAESESSHGLLPAAFWDPRNSVVPPMLRAFALLRWDGDQGGGGDDEEDGRTKRARLREDTMALFASMAQYAALCDPIPRKYQLQVVETAYYVFAAVCPSGPLVPALDNVRRADLLAALRSPERMPHHRRLVPAVLAAFSPPDGPFSHMIPALAAACGRPPITARELQYRSHARARMRSSLSLDEVRRILAAAACDATGRDEALFRFYLHTGCRSRAGTLLRVEDVWDARGQCPLRTGRVLEKKGRVRTFCIDAVLGEALGRHLRQSGRAAGLVFATATARPMTTDGVRFWFRRLAHSANVRGDHVFVHAIRRTYVTLLLQDGNRIEDISNSIDHSSVAMTQHYVDRTTAHQKMSIPWLRNDDRVMAIPTVQALTGRTNADADKEEEEDPSLSAAAAVARASESSGSELTIQKLLLVTEAQQRSLSSLAHMFNFIQTRLLTPAQQEQLSLFRENLDDDDDRNGRGDEDDIETIIDA